jgi:hypothetical protein
MTSAIDPTVPVEGTPTTASVRANFQTAHDEITALQNAAAAITAPQVALSPAIGTLGPTVQTALSTLNTNSAPLASPAFTGNPTAPTPAPGDNDTSIASTAFVQAAVASAQRNTGRNLLHNGLFNIAQRGAGPFGTSGNYTLDRWQLQTSGDTGVTVSQAAIPDAARTQIGDEAATYVLSLSTTGNAAAGAFTEITQSIEGVRRLAGKTITLSFWAVAGAAGLKVGLNGYSFYGTGGSPSAPASWQVTGTAITLATTWARYSATFAVPSSCGKTLGTAAGTDCNTLQIWLSSGATNNAQAGNIGVQSGTVQIWGIQVEIGGVATPLERYDPRVDLANCQRHYRSVICAARGTNPNAGMSLLTPATWEAMRATPTVTLNTAGVASNAISPTLTAATPYGGYFGGATAGAGDGYLLNYIYNLSAEL